MTNLGRRIRGAIGMGLTWAGAGIVAGTVLARVPGFESDLPFPLLFAPLGFLAGVIFSGILVAMGNRRRFEDMSITRFAAWGAASGLLLSGVFVIGAAVRGTSLLSEFLVFGPALGIASAASAAGSLALARRAERQALTAESDRSPVDAALDAHEKQELLGR